VFLLLLCNDREVLGPWVNAPWLNAVAALIVGMLVELSLILMASTMFPKINVPHLFVELTIVLGVTLAGGGIYTLYVSRRSPARAGIDAVAEIPKDRRHTWTMPPLALLERPVWSPGRKAGMLLLRGYLVVAVLLLIVKTVQLGH
jgi:hypothetical protein